MTGSTDELRVLMCPQCGAPADVPDAGGKIACGYCDGVLVVRARVIENVVIEDVELDPSLDAEAREAARLESLRGQAENYNSSNPYSYYDAPPGFEYLSGINELDPSVATMAQQAFKAALNSCPERKGSMAQQRAVYWVARKVKNIWTMRDDTLRARATLHAAHETLSDPGFLHLIRTNLADLARYEDDLEGARRWLSRCDPAPPLLDLDTSYRSSQAVLLVQEEDWSEVLRLVGEDRGTIPYEPSAVAVFNGLRVAALERLNRPDDAEAELRWLIEDSPVPVDFLRNMFEDSPTWEACREVWARVDAEAEEPGPDAESSPSPFALSASPTPIPAPLAPEEPGDESARARPNKTGLALVIALIVALAFAAGIAASLYS